MTVKNSNAKRKYENTMPTTDEGWWESVLAEERLHEQISRLESLKGEIEDRLGEAAREEEARVAQKATIMNFQGGKATDAWMGRLVPSRHNTSAPDMMFNRFRSTPAAGP